MALGDVQRMDSRQAPSALPSGQRLSSKAALSRAPGGSARSPLGQTYGMGKLPKYVRKTALTWTRGGSLKGRVNLPRADVPSSSPTSPPGGEADASPEEVGSAPLPEKPALPGTFDRRANRKQSWSPTEDGWNRTAPSGDAGPNS